MTIKIIGLPGLTEALKKIIENIGDVEIITKPLADLMRDYVHVDTGYLKSTIYHDGPVAGASAPYAGYETERGGSHDFASQAMEAFDISAYADAVVKPF
jgi:hypothetical protein